MSASRLFIPGGGDPAVLARREAARTLRLAADGARGTRRNQELLRRRVDQPTSKRSALKGIVGT